MRKLFLLSLLVAPSLFAHDFWLEPSTFRPLPGSTVAMRLRVGEHFAGDPIPRNDRKVLRFVARQGATETPLRGKHGSDPAGELDVREPGVVIVAYRGAPSEVSLEAAKFEQYLREEGLERIIEHRAARGESRKAGRELFSRSAKALLFTGGNATGFDAPAGLRLELIPENDPFAGSGALTVRVLFEGKPLAGVLLTAMHHDDGGQHLRARTGQDGRAAFTLRRKGAWLFKTTHMVAAPPASGADWESIWASLTFETDRGTIPR